MLCPSCGADTVVLETRPADTHSNDIARRRRCMNSYCKHTFSTRERVDVNLVVKRQTPVAENSVFKPFTPQDAAPPAPVAPHSTGYTPLQLSLHWLIVLVVFFQLIFGEDMGRYNYFLRSGQDVAPLVTGYYLHVGVGIAILVLTADIQETTRARCLELGAKGFLNKPVDHDVLRRILAELRADCGC